MLKFYLNMVNVVQDKLKVFVDMVNVSLDIINMYYRAW
jgi:hypothetical protein